MRDLQADLTYLKQIKYCFNVDVKDDTASLNADKFFEFEKLFREVQKIAFESVERAITAEEELFEAQADITMARVTNDKLLDIIIDLRKELEQLRKVADVAKDIAVNLVNMKCEGPESVIFQQRLKQTYGFNKLLLKALAELEV